MNELSNGFKIFFRFFLKYFLKFITKIVLRKHQPKIICLSGSINLPFTKEEVKRRLAEAGYQIRSNPKNFNTEIGLPLAILNLPSGYHSYKNWLPIIWQAIKSLFYSDFPKILVLSLGVSKPGDMKYLMSLVKPDIGIITDITQRYFESFDDMDELVGEYELFVKSIRSSGCVILNYDNPRVKKLMGIAEINFKLFGVEKPINPPADYWRGEVTRHDSAGQIIKVVNGEHSREYNLNYHGWHHVYALLAGLIVKDYFKSQDL